MIKKEEPKVSHFNCEIERILKFCPEPTRFFKVGDKVVVGNLKDVTIAEIRNASEEMIYQYFLKVNKTGKVMDKEHLKKVENLLANIKWQHQ